MDCREAQAMLTAFHDGELPGADRARVEDHLRGCPECGARLADLARLDAAANVPDPGQGYWDRFNARVMDRVAQADEGQGWPSVGAGRDAPGFEAPTGPNVAILRPKHGWMRQQLRYLVPAAAVAAMVMAVVRYGGLHPGAPAPARDGQVPGQAGMPRISEPRPTAMDGLVPGPAGPDPADRRVAKAEREPPATKKRESSTSARRVPEESPRVAGAPAPPKPSIADERSIAAAEPQVAEKKESASGMRIAEDRSAEAPAAASLGKSRSKAEPSPLASASRPADGQGRPSAGAGKDAPGFGAPADGHGWPSAGAGRDAPGSVAPASSCELARTQAAQGRWREAETAQRACLAQDRSAPAQEKGLVFLAELLDRQERFAEADAVIKEVDRQFPQSRPLDLYRQQRPMVQKQTMTVPGGR